MKQAFFIPVVIMALLCACSSSSGDTITAKDTAVLYAEFGQFLLNDLRAKPCEVNHDQELTVLGYGYNQDWEFEYVKVFSVTCNDGRLLTEAYGAASQFHAVSDR